MRIAVPIRVRVWGVLFLVACSAGSPELLIVSNQRPLDTCRLSQDRGEAIDHGVFDLAIGDRDSYVLTPLVRNTTSADLDVVAVRLRAFESGEILQFACTEGSCNTWDIDMCEDGCPRVPANDTASFEVPALARVVSGYYLGQMDAAVLDGRRPPEFEIEAEVTLLTSDLIASEPFRFPIRMCLGCLVTFPEESDSAARPGQDCCGFHRDEDSCFPGQDEGYSCRLCYQSVPEICNFGWLTCD